MFLRQMTDAFLVRTEPASSIVKPAHIHMTSTPQMRNEKVLRTNRVSRSIFAFAVEGVDWNDAVAATAARVATAPRPAAESVRNRRAFRVDAMHDGRRTAGSTVPGFPNRGRGIGLSVARRMPAPGRPPPWSCVVCYRAGGEIVITDDQPPGRAGCGG